MNSVARQRVNASAQQRQEAADVFRAVGAKQAAKRDQAAADRLTKGASELPRATTTEGKVGEFVGDFGPGIVGAERVVRSLVKTLVGTEAEAPSTAPKTERRVISANRVSKQDLSTADPVKLTTNQAKILEQLPKEGSTVIVPNSYFGLNDLSAITSKTGGVEFAVFTMGGRRMIVRGTRHGIDSIDTDVSAELGRQGWRLRHTPTRGGRSQT